MNQAKRGSMMIRALIYLVLIGILFALFFARIDDSVNGRTVKQQVIEKQLVLLIDSATPGMSFEISKRNLHGIIESVEIKEKKIFVAVDGLRSLAGYPYFNRYPVSVEEQKTKFIVRIG